MTVTLIIFIGDINAFYKGLYQSNQYIRCSVLSILSERKQPLLDFLNITNAFGFQRKTHPAISVCVEAFFLLLADRGRQFRILFRLSYPADKIIVPAS